MNTMLFELLVCPECSSELKCTISEGDRNYVKKGALTCASCNSTYPIFDDIPNFSPQQSHSGVKNQRDTYSEWWDSYHDEESIVNPAHRTAFHNSIGIEQDSFSGKVTLDAGCGNGRFSYVVSKYNPGLLVAFDISTGVLHARRSINKFSPKANVAYVQGDITKLPFKKESFDIVYSWGVMHHTPDTKSTFAKVASLVKKNGLFGTYLYEFHPIYSWEKQHLSFLATVRSLFLIRPMRALCSHLPSWAVVALFHPIYLFERILNFGIMGCHGTGDEKWSRSRYMRVVMDRFKSRYASEHQFEEVANWFKLNGFNKLKVGFSPRLSMTGLRTMSKSTNISVDFICEPEPLINEDKISKVG